MKYTELTPCKAERIDSKLVESNTTPSAPCANKVGASLEMSREPNRILNFFITNSSSATSLPLRLVPPVISTMGFAISLCKPDPYTERMVVSKIPSVVS